MNRYFVGWLAGMLTAAAIFYTIYIPPRTLPVSCPMLGAAVTCWKL